MILTAGLILAVCHLAEPVGPCRFCGEELEPALTARGWRTYRHAGADEACATGQRWALPA